MRYAAVELHFLLFSKERLCNFWSFPMENGQKHGTTPQIERFYYTPYGELYDQTSWIERSDPAISLFSDDIYRKKYNQKEHNYSTGLTFYDARYYAPELGRFVQADTMIPDIGNEQSFNRYGYVCGSPVEFRDWSGNKGIGGLFGKIGNAITEGIKCAVSQISTKVQTSIDDTADVIQEQKEKDKKNWKNDWGKFLDKAKSTATAIVAGVALAAVMTVAVALLISTAGIGAPVAWAIVGAGVGFVVGGTDGGILENPGDYGPGSDKWSDFDVKKGLIGAAIGGTIGALGQVIPHELSNSYFNNGFGAENSILDIVPDMFAEYIPTGLDSYLLNAGISTGSLTIYGTALGYDYFKNRE
jgi:RHS repeat-associated protein